MVANKNILQIYSYHYNRLKKYIQGCPNDSEQFRNRIYLCKFDVNFCPTQRKIKSLFILNKFKQIYSALLDEQLVLQVSYIIKIANP